MSALGWREVCALEAEAIAAQHRYTGEAQRILGARWSPDERAAVAKYHQDLAERIAVNAADGTSE